MPQWQLCGFISGMNFTHQATFFPPYPQPQEEKWIADGILGLFCNSSPFFIIQAIIAFVYHCPFLHNNLTWPWMRINAAFRQYRWLGQPNLSLYSFLANAAGYKSCRCPSSTEVPVIVLIETRDCASTERKESPGSWAIWQYSLSLKQKCSFMLLTMFQHYFPKSSPAWLLTYKLWNIENCTPWCQCMRRIHFH